MTNINKYIQNTENLQNNTVTLTLSDRCPPSGSMPTGNSSWSNFTTQLSIVYYNIISNYGTYGGGPWQSLIKYIAESFLALTPNLILYNYQGSSSDYQGFQKVFPEEGRDNTILDNLTPSTQKQLWNSYTNDDFFTISDDNFETFSSMMQDFAGRGNYCKFLANMILYQMLAYTTLFQMSIYEVLDDIGGSSPGSLCTIGYYWPGFCMATQQRWLSCREAC